jgi:hypothetical protein
MKSRKSFLLRINPALYEALEAWAQQEFRSVNGHIEYLLKEAVSKHRGSDAMGKEERSPEGTETTFPEQVVDKGVFKERPTPRET